MVATRLGKALLHVSMAAMDLREVQPGCRRYTVEAFRKANEAFVVMVARALAAGATPGQINQMTEGSDL